jgi:hypothetical protein
VDLDGAAQTEHDQEHVDLRSIDHIFGAPKRGALTPGRGVDKLVIAEICTGEDAAIILATQLFDLEKDLVHDGRGKNRHPDDILCSG